jgi:hypothetical protein
MALKGRKPEVTKARFKALVYANTGVGKTHFCCSFPNVYYIDSENLTNYPHLVKMIIDNDGDHVLIRELTDIIKEVKELLSVKHKYKTLVIDSLSFPCGLLANLEADRLAAKSAGSEGTEFGANLAKAKRLTLHLGILLSRLDMNVIVTAHEKTRFIDGKEVGKTYDINEKMAYSLGTVLNLRQHGSSKKAFVEKSRYPQIKLGELIDFNDGYETVKSIFGSCIFDDESVAEVLATPDQITEVKRLIQVLSIPDETVQKILIKGQAQSLDEMSGENVQKCIDNFKSRLLQGEAA